MKGWKTKPCGCVKARLPLAGKVAIRCSRHRAKAAPKGWMHAYFDADGIVRTDV